jgi:hypothetical protein
MKNLTLATILGISATTAAMVLGAAPAQAVNFSYTGSYTGSFGGDADVQSFLFTANGTSTVTLRSYGYAGGTNATGTTIARGGFDPILGLFNATTGDLIRQVDDTPGFPDPVTGRSFDPNFSQILAAGDYRAVISQYGNFVVNSNFNNGYSQSSPTFTSSYNCSNGQFCEVGGNNRTSAWAFDVAVRNNATSVPEPADLIGTTVAGFAVIGLKRKLGSNKKINLKISD